MACASDFTWSFPDAAVAPKAEVCTFLYAKWIKLGDAWGNWRLFPLLPDEEPLPVVAIRFNAVPAFNRVEVWAAE